jgi:hypothetical protein
MLADEMVGRATDCQDQKDLQTELFSKRLMGFEPSTFCMASSTCEPTPAADIPCKRRGSRL